MDPEPTSSNPPDYDYPRNTAVELTAVPVEGKTFTHWEILDPNYPGDANYAVVDSNNPITIVMMDDREVTAAFKCGSGMLPLLPALGVLGVVCLRRRR